MQPVDAETFAGLWRQTFSPGAHFLKAVSMRVDRPGRVVSFAGGEVRIDDRHSRLRVPIGSAEGALEELFGIDRGLLARAFGIAGRPEPEARETTLTAYLEAAAGPDEAFRTVATRQGYRRLIGGVADVVGEEATTEGFRLTLAPPGTADGDDGDGGRLVEDVAVVPGSRRVRIERQIGAAGAVSRSAYAVEIRAGRTYLVREAVLPGVREDLLRNDSLRGRLAGSLAVDLLAWARRIRDADAGEEAARNP